MGGMNKDKIKLRLKNLFRVRTWKLLLILLPLMFLTATLLRYEHIEMVRLKEAVLEADENGNDEEIAENLGALKKYTFSHVVVNVISENGMERVVFGTGPFYLENQYTRKAKDELAKAEESMGSADDNPNGNVFKKAAAVCDELGRQNGWNYNTAYFDCIFAELEKYPVMDEIEDYQQAMLPSTSLYRHDYASPLWAPTWSGWAILLCLILGVVIFIRLLIWLTLRIGLIFVKR